MRPPTGVGVEATEAAAPEAGSAATQPPGATPSETPAGLPKARRRRKRFVL